MESASTSYLNPASSSIVISAVVLVLALLYYRYSTWRKGHVGIDDAEDASFLSKGPNLSALSLHSPTRARLQTGAISSQGCALHFQVTLSAVMHHVKSAGSHNSDATATASQHLLPACCVDLVCVLRHNSLMHARVCSA